MQTRAERNGAVLKQRQQNIYISEVNKLAFLYCLSPTSCAATAEESVAFKEGSPEESTENKIREFGQILLLLKMLNVNQTRPLFFAGYF